MAEPSVATSLDPTARWGVPNGAPHRRVRDFPISRPAVSQHLRALEDAELVSVRRDGTRRWYRARPEGLAELEAWLTEMWAGGLTALKQAAEREAWANRTRARTKSQKQPTKKQPAKSNPTKKGRT